MHLSHMIYLKIVWHFLAIINSVIWVIFEKRRYAFKPPHRLWYPGG